MLYFYYHFYFVSRSYNLYKALFFYRKKKAERDNIFIFTPLKDKVTAMYPYRVFHINEDRYHICGIIYKHPLPTAKIHYRVTAL